MSKIYLNLGKSGDLLNLCPLLHHDAYSHGPQRLMVSREFAPLLEGMSYIEPVLWDGPYHEIEKAYRHAQLSPQEIVCTQITGPREAVAEFCYRPVGLNKGAVTTSFQKEQWRVAKRLGEWDFAYPLCVDRRNSEREARLLDNSGVTAKKRTKSLMLVSVKGTSSPFPWSKLLLGLLKMKFGREYMILELPQAERLYDLLALYERAAVLVATDSAPLHLARACPDLPVVAFVQDKPQLWNGSAMQPQHIFYCRYGDFPDRAMEMLDVIADRGRWKFRPNSSEEILLVQNEYEAESSGESPPGFVRVPIRAGACGRDSLGMGDQKRIPLLRDCIKLALPRAQPHHWIAVAKNGVRFQECTSHVLREHEACYAHRLAEGSEGETYQPTCDLFCARKSWWERTIYETPSYLFGGDIYWPQGLWALFKLKKAADVTGVVTWRK